MDVDVGTPGARARRDREYRARLIERLVAERREGPLRRAVVRAAAEACGVSERTVWRWVGDGGPPGSRSGGWELSDRARELFVQWRGSVAAVHRAMVTEGEPVPSKRTLERAFARELAAVERDHARRGSEALRDRSVYLRHEARFRGECYEADHKQLSIEVLAPRATRPSRPSVTLFVDQFSRALVGWAISLRPTQAEVLAALRAAVTVDSARGSLGACRCCCAGTGALSSPRARSRRRA